VFSILVIWVAIIPAVIVEPGGWWAIIFAVLATGAIGVSAWRRLGLSRVIAIAGIWGGVAAGIIGDADNTWASVFGFLATGAVVYSGMRRNAYLTGAAIALAWAVVGAAGWRSEGDATWICVFAFLTAGAVANGGGGIARGLSMLVWWGAAGAIMLSLDGWYWLAVIAFILSATSIGFSDFSFPRKFEWDLFDRDKDDDVKVVN
jgi:hypothetical protein